MKEDRGGQAETACDKPGRVGIGFALVVPNPKLKRLDPVREVLRLKHYALRTERCYCDWIRRYLRFHGMRSREELLPGTEKVEPFLTPASAGLGFRDEAGHGAGRERVEGPVHGAGGERGAGLAGASGAGATNASDGFAGRLRGGVSAWGAG